MLAAAYYITGLACWCLVACVVLIPYERTCIEVLACVVLIPYERTRIEVLAGACLCDTDTL